MKRVLLTSLVILLCGCAQGQEKAIVGFPEPVVRSKVKIEANLAPVFAPDDPFRAREPMGGPEVTVYSPIIEDTKRPNGIRVLYVPMSTWYMGAVSLSSDLGESAFADRPSGLRFAALRGAWFSAGGVLVQDRFRSLAGLVAEFDYSVNSEGQEHTMIAGGAAMPEACRHLFEAASRPDFPSSNLEFIKGQLGAFRESMLKSDGSRSYWAFCKATIGQDNTSCRRLHMDPTDVSTLSRDSLAKAHEEMFQPEHLTLIVAGDFDKQKLYEVVDGAFKDRVASKSSPKPRGKSSAAKAPMIQASQARIIVVDRPSSGNALLIYGSGLGSRPYQEMAAVLVTNQFMVGGQSGAINQSLSHDLIINSSLWGHEYWYKSVAFNTWESRVDYQSVDLVVREIQRQIRRGMNGSIDSEQLQAARNRAFYSRAAGLESASSIVSLLRKQLQMGAPPSEIHDAFSRVTTTTAEQVQQVLRTWFDPDKAKVLIVGDYRQLKAPLSRLEMGPIEIRDLEGEVLRTEDLSKAR